MKFGRVTLIALGALLCVQLAPSSAGGMGSRLPQRPEPHVVVATLDTGGNVFHPTWHRDQYRHPSRFIPGYPQSAPALRLRFDADYAKTVFSNNRELKRLSKGHPYWIPGTNIIGTWAHPTDRAPVFDARNFTQPSHAHGAQASSQIAGKGFGLAPQAYIVIVDRTPDPDFDYETNAEALKWAADQPWIDIIHTNIQDPVPLTNETMPAVVRNFPDAVRYALDKGKLVVSAGGNYFAEFTETSPHAGPPGVLVAGANDNCGYTDYSNADPHVVMDGYGTVSAAPNSYEEAEFSGTSSASPRITGYVAQLLLSLRRYFGYTDGIKDGALLKLAPPERPKQGPLEDGELTAAELHEIVRRTANPNPHDSKWDGAQEIYCVPQPMDLPFAFYPKMGYGEVSEHTIDAAFRVAIGKDPMPGRPYEDMFYEASEEARRAFWGD